MAVVGGRICKALFDRLDEDPSQPNKVEVSYFEIYNEQVYDLLSTPTVASSRMTNGGVAKEKGLRVREHKVLGPYIEGMLCIHQSMRIATGTMRRGGPCHLPPRSLLFVRLHAHAHDALAPCCCCSPFRLLIFSSPLARGWSVAGLVGLTHLATADFAGIHKILAKGNTNRHTGAYVHARVADR